MAESKTFILRDDAILSRLQTHLAGAWKAAQDAGKPLVVEVHPERSKRSSAANRRYWAILQQIAESAWIPTGWNGKRQYSADTWHQFFKGQFIGFEDLPHGRQAPLSTQTLNTAEFALYVEKVEAYAATELGVQILEVA